MNTKANEAHFFIKGNSWYRNTNIINHDMKQLDAVIEICYKKDMLILKNAHHWDKPRLIVEFARKYPHHKIV